jgi:hypothetical protein
MRELKLDLRSLYPDLAEEGSYDYSILVEQVKAGSFACECYGVQVTFRATGERAQAPNVTVSARRIDELMERLVRNQVGPIHLQDVIDDWL